MYMFVVGVMAGEPISVSVNSETARLTLSPVSPGSTYEVRVMSVLGRDESDSIQDTVTTCKLPIISRESDIENQWLKISIYPCTCSIFCITTSNINSFKIIY